MSGVQIIIDPGQFGHAARYFNGLAGLAGDMAPLMDAVGLYLVGAAIENFEEESTPDGAPWQPSLRARQQGGQTLSHTGRLKASITHQATASEVIIGSNVHYAAIHQLGGTIVPRTAKALHFVIGGRDVFVQSVTIPARPFLGIGRQEIDDIADLALAYFGGSLDGEAVPA